MNLMPQFAESPHRTGEKNSGNTIRNRSLRQPSRPDRNSPEPEPTCRSPLKPASTEPNARPAPTPHPIP